MEPVVELPDRSGVVPLYANITHASYTPYDVLLTFSLLTTPLGELRDRPLTPTSPPVAVAEIVLPPAAAESLVRLLQARLEELAAQSGT